MNIDSQSLSARLGRILIIGFLVIGAAACGGGGGNSLPALSLSADATQVTMGGGPVTLTSARTSLDGPVSWSQEPASVGSIDASSGDRVRYSPPPAGSSDTGMEVTLTASAGGLSRKISILIHPSPGLYLVAGTTGGRGTTDGVGTAARFNNPWGIAADAAGNFFVADTSSHTIRKITPAGVVSTLSGTANISGSKDGAMATAQFNLPGAIALDGAGNIYVADYGNHTIRKITSAGAVTTLAGMAGLTGSADGVGATARFSSLRGLASDNAGNLYVTDGYAVRKIAPDGTVKTLAGTVDYSDLLAYSTGDGIGADARFLRPFGIAMGNDGNLYVMDGAAVRKVTPTGTVTTLAGNVHFGGRADGQGSAAYFNGAFAIAADGSGNLYVFDEGFLRKVSLTGMVTTIVQHPEQFELETYSRARVGMTATADGSVYVAANSIKRVSPVGDVTTLAGDAGNVGGIADGVGEQARFTGPTGIAADRAGNLYVIDRFGEWSSSVLRKISATKTVTTLTAATDSTRHTALATDASGNLYFSTTEWTSCLCDFKAGRNAIIKKSFTGPDQILLDSNTSGMTTDSSGNIYFTGGTGGGSIRKLSPPGAVTVLADALSSTGAFLSGGIAASADGSLVFIDRHSVRKMTSAGAMAMVAGSAEDRGAVDGKSTAARFNSPTAIAIDPAGNLYVTDTGNYTIRKIATDGTVSTLAGLAGKIGVTTGALPGSLDAPLGVAFADLNMLFITTGKCVLKLILPPGI